MWQPAYSWQAAGIQEPEWKGVASVEGGASRPLLRARRGVGGECLASPWAAENWSAADPSGACRERGGPRGWEGAGSRLLLQQGAAGWGAPVQLPLNRVSEQSPPRSGALRVSALPQTPVGLLIGVPEGEWGWEAEPWATEEPGGCGIAADPWARESFVWWRG